MIVAAVAFHSKFGKVWFRFSPEEILIRKSNWQFVWRSVYLHKYSKIALFLQLPPPLVDILTIF